MEPSGCPDKAVRRKPPAQPAAAISGRSWPSPSITADRENESTSPSPCTQGEGGGGGRTSIGCHAPYRNPAVLDFPEGRIILKSDHAQRLRTGSPGGRTNHRPRRG